MKKFAFLALLFLLYYIAVMYESSALMVIYTENEYGKCCPAAGKPVYGVFDYPV